MIDRLSRVGVRVALLLGAFVSGQLAQRAVHELGHAIGTWVTGGEVYRIILHPFLEGRCEHSTTSFPMITTLAGVGFSILVGSVAILLSRRYHHPMLAPLVMMGIAAFFSSGFYYIVGVIIPFGDPGYLTNALGASSILVLLFGISMVGLGIVAATPALGPVFGMGSHEPIGRMILTLSLGVLPLFVASLAYRQVFDMGGRRIAAAYIVAGMVSVLLIAFGSRILLTRTPLFPNSGAAAEVRWSHSVFSLVVGATIIVVELFAYN